MNVSSSGLLCRQPKFRKRVEIGQNLTKILQKLWPILLNEATNPGNISLLPNNFGNKSEMRVFSPYCHKPLLPLTRLCARKNDLLRGVVHMCERVKQKSRIIPPALHKRRNSLLFLLHVNKPSSKQVW